MSYGGPEALKDRYKAIFFDAGGTLIYAHFEEVFVSLCKRYGLVLDSEKVAEAYSMFASENSDFFKRHNKLLAENWEEFWILCNRRILEHVGVEENTTSLAKRITHDFPLPTEIDWKFYSDVPDALAGLKQKGFVLGVISNFDPSLEDILIKLDLAHYFETVATSKRVKYAKPDPRIFTVVLKDLAVKPVEVAYVGDSYDSDVVGARNAGLTPILVDRKHEYGEVDCLKIYNLGELMSLFS
jgi:REG-2-like HAD superfamily hydrolase